MVKDLQVTVGTVVYDICSAGSEFQDYGVHYASQQKIYIKTGLSRERAYETILHELLHAILFEYGIEEDSSPKTELFVRQFTTALLDVLP